MTPAFARPHLARAIAAVAASGRGPWQTGAPAFLLGRHGSLSRLEIGEAHAASAERMLRPLLRQVEDAKVLSSDACGAEGISICLTDARDTETGAPFIACRLNEGGVVAVSGYGMIFVAPPWRGLGLGAELSLYSRMLEDDDGHGAHLYSPGGLAAAISGYELGCRIGADLGYHDRLADVMIDAGLMRRRYGLDRPRGSPSPEA